MSLKISKQAEQAAERVFNMGRHTQVVGPHGYPGQCDEIVQKAINEATDELTRQLAAKDAEIERLRNHFSYLKVACKGSITTDAAIIRSVVEDVEKDISVDSSLLEAVKNMLSEETL